ncbi:hypothetical protein GOP47_0014965 [Adiantum capillus-veneris]|uniref:Smr domain-containing protein n=1 Tax=Adiantum capillus-veneris TaxID=13818 RepID=A0A9D4UN10_ADICA|nr:hypothetical protein GOP47_0014965 [Adiantum capillus-veneris]
MDPLIQQRNTLKSQAEAAALVLFNAKRLHDELEAEADSLQTRIGALRLQREDRVKKEVHVAKSYMDEIVSNFESSSKGLDKNEKSMSMGEALSAIASVVDSYMNTFVAPAKARVQLEAANKPSVGDSVLIRSLGKKRATVIEGPTEDDESFLVQLGGLKVRAKLSEVTKLLKPEKVGPQQRMKRVAAEPPEEEVRSGLVLQTSRNSVDLRGMRVDEALMNLDFAFLKHRRSSIFFVIHGEGTGALRAAVLERLKGHPLVLKFEQESPMNYGCTAVYLK